VEPGVGKAELLGALHDLVVVRRRGQGDAEIHFVPPSSYSSPPLGGEVRRGGLHLDEDHLTYPLLRNGSLPLPRYAAERTVLHVSASAASMLSRAAKSPSVWTGCRQT